MEREVWVEREVLGGAGGVGWSRRFRWSGRCLFEYKWILFVAPLTTSIRACYPVYTTTRCRHFNSIQKALLAQLLLSYQTVLPKHYLSMFFVPDGKYVFLPYECFVLCLCIVKKKIIIKK